MAQLGFQGGPRSTWTCAWIPLTVGLLNKLCESKESLFASGAGKAVNGFRRQYFGMVSCSIPKAVGTNLVAFMVTTVLAPLLGSVVAGLTMASKPAFHVITQIGVAGAQDAMQLSGAFSRLNTGNGNTLVEQVIKTIAQPVQRHDKPDSTTSAPAESSAEQGIGVNCLPWTDGDDRNDSVDSAKVHAELDGRSPTRQGRRKQGNWIDQSHALQQDTSLLNKSLETLIPHWINAVVCGILGKLDTMYQRQRRLSAQ